MARALLWLATRAVVDYPVLMNVTVEAAEPVVVEPPRRYTYDELVAEMPESNQPCELWDGEVVTSPAPSFFHQEVAFRLHRALHDWVTTHRLGKVIGAPIDMVLSPRRAVQPDVAFIAQDRLDIIQRAIMGPADLAVEIVSLGGRRRDRIDKRDLYEQYGVKEYWIVDAEAGTVEVLALMNGRFELSLRRGRGLQATSTLLPGFTVSVDEILGPAPGT